MHNVKILISNLSVRLPVYFCSLSTRVCSFPCQHFLNFPPLFPFACVSHSGNRSLCASSPFDARHLWVLSRIELSSLPILPQSFLSSQPATLARRLILIATETSTRRRCRSRSSWAGVGSGSQQAFFGKCQNYIKKCQRNVGDKTDGRIERQTQRVKKLTVGDDEQWWYKANEWNA